MHYSIIQKNWDSNDPTVDCYCLPGTTRDTRPLSGATSVYRTIRDHHFGSKIVCKTAIHPALRVWLNHLMHGQIRVAGGLFSIRPVPPCCFNWEDSNRHHDCAGPRKSSTAPRKFEEPIRATASNAKTPFWATTETRSCDISLIPAKTAHTNSSQNTNSNHATTCRRPGQQLQMPSGPFYIRTRRKHTTDSGNADPLGWPRVPEYRLPSHPDTTAQYSTPLVRERR